MEPPNVTARCLNQDQRLNTCPHGCKQPLFSIKFVYRTVSRELRFWLLVFIHFFSFCGMQVTGSPWGGNRLWHSWHNLSYG